MPDARVESVAHFYLSDFFIGYSDEEIAFINKNFPSSSLGKAVWQDNLTPAQVEAFRNFLKAGGTIAPKPEPVQPQVDMPPMWFRDP